MISRAGLLNTADVSPGALALFCCLAALSARAGDAPANSTTDTTVAPKAAVQWTAQGAPRVGVGKRSPGDAYAINPQPLPPFPSETTETLRHKPIGWGPQTGASGQQMKVNPAAACRPRAYGASNAPSNGGANDISPDSLSAYCSSRPQSLDETLNVTMGKRTTATGKTTTSNWSQAAQPPAQALSSGADLQMNSIQNQVTQRQVVVDTTTDLLNSETQALKNCKPPNCLIQNIGK